jgi:hypothetical protein
MNDRRSITDDLVGSDQERLRDRQPERLAAFMLITNSNFIGCSTGEVGQL